MRVNLKRINWFLKIFLILVLGLGILFYPQKQAKALNWYEQLIPDPSFINKYSMSEQQVQDFLVSKGSYLANYSAQWGVWRTAAQWIYEEGREHGINPQVIIVTLQKEMGLITLSNPSQHRLDWAMGYGAFSGCAPDGGWCTQYAGFGAQIHYATSMMRYNFDLGRGPGSSHVGDTYPITTRSWEPGIYTSVYLSNRATAVLYRYTPYIYNGNYNFYTINRDWFGTWDYTIKKLLDSQAVYLIDGNTKRPVYNQYVFEQFGFSWGRIETDSSIGSMPTGPVVYNIIKGDQSDSVYLINLGRKHPVVNGEVFESWGFKWWGVATLSQATVNAIPSGTLLTRLARGHERDTVYMFDNGLKHPIKNIDTFINFGWQWDYLSTISQRMADGIPQGALLTRLVKGSSPSVYLMENSQRRPFLNEAAFSRSGFSWSEITPLSDRFILGYPLGSTIR